MADGGSKAERDLKQDVEALRADFDSLRQDVGQLVATLKGNAGDRAEAELEQFRERLNRLAADVRTGGRERMRNVESQIEERPLTSLAMAFAVGLMLGRLFDRR